MEVTVLGARASGASGGAALHRAGADGPAGRRPAGVGTAGGRPPGPGVLPAAVVEPTESTGVGAPTPRTVRTVPDPPEPRSAA